MKKNNLFIYLLLLLPLGMAWGQNDTLKLEDIAYLTKPTMIRFDSSLKHDYTFYPDKIKHLPHFTDVCGFFDNYAYLFPRRTMDSLVHVPPKLENICSFQHYINGKQVRSYGGYSAASIRYFSPEECKQKNYPDSLIKRVNFSIDTSAQDSLPILVDEAAALQIALDSFPTDKYLWEVTAKRNGLDPNDYRPRSEVFLKQFERNGPYEPVYKFGIAWAKRPFGWYVYVSAHSGKIVQTHRAWSDAFPCNHNTDEMVMLPTDYGTKNIPAQYCDYNSNSSSNCKNYRLYNSRGGNVPFRTAYNVNALVKDVTWSKNGTDIPPSVEITVTANTTSGYEVEVIVDEDPTDMHPFNGLNVGFNTVTLIPKDGCEYELVIAIGNSQNPDIYVDMNNIIHDDCYRNNPDILMHFPTSSGGFEVNIKGMGIEFYEFVTLEESINLTTLFNMVTNDKYFPAGNYGIIVKDYSIDFNNPLIFAFNVRIDRDGQDCAAPKQLAYTAHFGLHTAHHFFNNLFGTTNGFLKMLNMPPSDPGNPNVSNELRIDLGTATSYSSMPPPLGTIMLKHAVNYVSADIIGHEYTHALEENRLTPNGMPIDDIVQSGESGALLEGFCDLFGLIIEQNIDPNRDWIIAEQGGAADIRNVADPKASARPDTYNSPLSYNTGNSQTSGYWCTTSECNNMELIHYNSTVFSHWYYLLVHGTNGNTLTNDHGWSYILSSTSETIAQEILFEAFNTMTNKNITFSEMCALTLQIAADKHGSVCGDVYTAVANAWYAVGLEKDSINCDGYLGCNQVEPNGADPDDKTICIGDPLLIHGTFSDHDGFNTLTPTYDLPPEFGAPDQKNFVMQGTIGGYYDLYWSAINPTTPCGPYTVSITIEDDCGTSFTDIFIVHVVDGINCAIDCPPIDCIDTFSEQFICSVENAACQEDDGHINILTDYGGSGYYTYLIESNTDATITYNGDVSIIGEDQTIPNISPGDYTITIEDPATNCEISQDFIIESQLFAEKPILSDWVPVDCPPATCMGRVVTITVIGGSGNYTYNWPNPDCSNTQNSCLLVMPMSTNPYETFTETITVTDAANPECTIDVLVSFHKPLITYEYINGSCSPPYPVYNDIECQSRLSLSSAALDQPIKATFAIEDKSIENKEEQVAITISARHADGKFETAIFKEDIQYNKEYTTTFDPTEWPEGAYTFELARNSSTPSGPSTCPNPDPVFGFVPCDDISVSISQQDSDSCSPCDGYISVTPSGGTGTYNYSWLDCPTCNTPTRQNLCAGTYYVVVADTDDCVRVESITLASPLDVTYQTGNACNGNDGSIDLSVTGGSGNYFYAWQDCDNLDCNSPTQTDLEPGEYIVTVFDQETNCYVTQVITITGASTPITLSHQIIKRPGCGRMGSCSGKVDLSVAGGSGDYSYLWNRCGLVINGTVCNASSYSNLCQGSHSVTVTDNQTGCTDNITFQLSCQSFNPIPFPCRGKLDVQPNPFRESIHLNFGVEKAGEPQLTEESESVKVRIELMNILGKPVGTIYEGAIKFGEPYQTRYNASRLPPGKYLTVMYLPCGRAVSRTIVKI